ncbi:MAG: hypothetical protein QM811_29500 [Pirellulales bacterium]
MAGLGRSRTLILVAGIVIGLLCGTLVPPNQLHAVATQGGEGFSVCTAELESGFEAIYYLDYQTGDLTCFALHPRTLPKPKFNYMATHNILDDFKDAKSTKFLLISGSSDLNTNVTTNKRMSTGIVYVVEVVSGMVCAYGAPYPTNRVSVQLPVKETMVLIDKAKFRGAGVRDAK